MKEFKLIVAGGRDFSDETVMVEELERLVEKELAPFSVSLVSGMARGADKLAWAFAKANSVLCYEYQAKWKEHGNSAGYIRNAEMAQFADGLLAFWDGESRGTKHMIETMRKQDKPVRVIEY